MTLPPPASIHVCALRHIPEVLARTGARHLVSAINADLIPATPRTLSPGNHLKLDMHDITEVQPGSMAPALEHVSELLDFVRGWDRQAPLLIHCYAGLSRSTAAAYITLCALNPHAPEATVARALRRASDTAVPNRLFVRWPTPCLAAKAAWSQPSTAWVRTASPPSAYPSASMACTVRPPPRAPLGRPDPATSSPRHPRNRQCEPLAARARWHGLSAGSEHGDTPRHEMR